MKEVRCGVRSSVRGEVRDKGGCTLRFNTPLAVLLAVGRHWSVIFIIFCTVSKVQCSVGGGPVQRLLQSHIILTGQS